MPLIQVGLIRGPWFIPLAYIRSLVPPGREAIKTRSQKEKKKSSPPDNLISYSKF
jgi:hypothetical protein